MVLFEDLKDFRVLKVFTRFGRPYDGKPIPMPIIPQAVYTSMNMAPIPEDGLKLHAKEIMPVICQIEGQLVTERRDLPVCRDAEGNFVSGNGLNKLAVIERHHALGNIGLGIVQGFNIHGGAIASTVAHDSHNLVMVGDNDDDHAACGRVPQGMRRRLLRGEPRHSPGPPAPAHSRPYD